VIIDAHTHVWPDSIAARALAGTVPGLESFGDGTVADLRRSMHAAGVDRSVVLGVANTADHVHKVQRFVGSLDRDSFIGFGSIHPDLNVDANLTSLAEAGVRGIKIHPIFQRFALDDARLTPILGQLDPGFVVVVHVGGGGSAEQAAMATPQMVVDLSRRFPHLNVVACHFGGYHRFADALDVVCGERVFVDTSWPPSMAELDPESVRAFVRRHGADRVLFASDWPMADQGAEVSAVRRLGLSGEDTDLVLGGNLSRLLSL
jgi:predicted TIM-barrel fold metal-dependent hydrolase